MSANRRGRLLRIKARSKDATVADWAEKIGAATFDWLLRVTGRPMGSAVVRTTKGAAADSAGSTRTWFLTITVSVLADAARMETVHSEAPPAS